MNVEVRRLHSAGERHADLATIHPDELFGSVCEPHLPLPRLQIRVGFQFVEILVADLIKVVPEQLAVQGE